MVRWGILGTGRVADTWVAPAIAADPTSVPLAVGGRDAERAGDLARRHGFSRSYGSYEDLLADPDVDAVYIATPNALHVDQVLACAERGKHVLCEKPLALTAPDARRAAEACAAADVLLRTNLQYRHHPGLQRVHELLAGGEVGELQIIRAEIGGAYPLRSWRTDPELAGMGAALNMGVHAYDLVEWLTDRPVHTVSAVLGGWQGELETIALATFELEGGALAIVDANQCVAASRPDLHVDGAGGRISAIGCLRLGQAGEVRLLQPEQETRWPTSGTAMFAAAVGAFAAAIGRGDRDPGAGGGVRSAELVDALAASAAGGTRVRLEAGVAS